VHGSAAVRAFDPGYYANSCIDGYVATLAADGSLHWDLHIGTSDGVDDASAVAEAPDGGLYVAGGFQPPLVVPGIQTPEAFGGVDFYVVALDAQGQARWARSYGSALHEGDSARLRALPSGDVAMQGNFSAMPPAGFVALLDAQGAERWRANMTAHAVGTMIFAGDHLLLATSGELLAIDQLGQLTSHTQSAATWAARLAATDRGTVLLHTPGTPLLEVTDSGETLRELDLGDAAQPWYYGAVCSGPNGALAVTGTAKVASQFGFLDEPLAGSAGATFVLHLAEWGAVLVH
jgi:outer membrane protein assembly factor BamB